MQSQVLPSPDVNRPLETDFAQGFRKAVAQAGKVNFPSSTARSAAHKAHSSSLITALPQAMVTRIAPIEDVLQAIFPASDAPQARITTSGKVIIEAIEAGPTNTRGYHGLVAQGWREQNWFISSKAGRSVQGIFRI